MDKILYIGIDFSLKSPAICLFYKNKYNWISHCSKINKPKKDSKIQAEISKMNDIVMKFQDDLLTGIDYSTKDSSNIANYRNHSEELIKLLLSVISKYNDVEQIIIGFEGYSFNSFSNSNNIIDIVAATTTFKNKIIDVLSIEKKYNTKIEIIAPVTLKQFAGYSKFDKVDLFDVFTNNYTYITEKWSKEIENDYHKRIIKNKPSVFKLDYKDKLIKGEFYEYCLKLDLNRNLKKIKVPKPIDDMIDAYFVCCWLKERYSKC